MSFTIDVRSDINNITKFMNNMEKKQLPFAVTLTLNKLALMSQDYICKRIPVIFNNSRKWWDRKQKTGVKVSFSTKYALVSSVYTKAQFAFLQEQGGTKLPYRGSTIAVPTRHVPKRQRSSKALIEQQGNRSIFKLGKSIYKRISNHQLQRLYILTLQAKIRPRFGFKNMALNVFKRRFDAIFAREFNFAISTAK